MLEKIKGQGRLESTAPPEKVRQVTYHFNITTNIVRRPGFPPLEGNASSVGTVLSSDGKAIPEGTYQLYTDDGEILRVKNLGLNQWAILAG